jgi:hypothetical protein
VVAKRHANAQPGLAVICRDALQGIADATVVIGARAPSVRPRDRLLYDGREGGKDLSGVIPPMIPCDKPDKVRSIRPLHMPEARKP